MNLARFGLGLSLLGALAACSSHSTNNNKGTGGSTSTSTGSTSNGTGATSNSTGATSNSTGAGAGNDGSGGTDSTPSNVSPLMACEDYCGNGDTCGYEVAPSCASACAEGISLFDADCQDLAIAEAECSGSLECDELEAYFSDRRGDTICGQAYGDLFNNCTYRQGAVPQECSDYCNSLVDCFGAAYDQVTCEDNCTIFLTQIDLSAGNSDCVTGWEALYECTSGSDCASIANFDGGVSAPAECSYETSLIDVACDETGR